MYFVWRIYKRGETEYLPVDCHYLGINNVMVYADAMKDEQSFAKDGGNNFAVDLVGQINLLNQGKYLHDVRILIQSRFCIGVAGYPENI
jgi:methylenetetrahydrofolate reductase (NADPH)